MNVLRLLVAGVMVCALSANVRAEEKVEKKDNAKLLMGSWEVTKAAEGTVPVGSVVEFGKDGKMKATHKDGDKDVTSEGTYKVDGDKFTIMMKDMKINITIKKISDKELVTANDEGKVVEFKKKK